MIILQRKSDDEAWKCCKCVLQGVQRACDVELFLDPMNQYCAVPISYLSGKEELEYGLKVQKRKASMIRITSYSANIVELQARRRGSIGSKMLIDIIHRQLIKEHKKVTYALGPNAVLMVTSCDGCAYFCALNAGDKGLMMRLTVESSQGTEIACGQNNDTHIVPSKSQMIVLILINDGHHSTQNIDFRYQVDSCRETTSISLKEKALYNGVRSRVDLTLSGELLCRETGSQSGYKSGKGTMDERLWESGSITSFR